MGSLLSEQANEDKENTNRIFEENRLLSSMDQMFTQYTDLRRVIEPNEIRQPQGD
jgi:hypothetical protein